MSESSPDVQPEGQTPPVIRIPDWIIGFVGRQQLELELLRQQLSATQAQAQALPAEPDAAN